MGREGGEGVIMEGTFLFHNIILVDFDSKSASNTISYSCNWNLKSLQLNASYKKLKLEESR